MAKQKKRDKCVVVNEIYFNLIKKKAALLDEITDSGDVGIRIDSSVLKDAEKIYKEWYKQEAEDLGGSEPYTEPKD